MGRMRRALGTLLMSDEGAAQERWIEEQSLKAKLVEYEQLRVEIQNRSNSQNRLIQIHLTVLLAIVAAVTSETVAIGWWILLLVPVEAAVFGMWWIDHSTAIREIGAYLASHHERGIDEMLGRSNVIGWERQHRKHGAKHQESWRKSVRSMHRWTFFHIGWMITALTLVAVIFSLPLGWPDDVKWTMQRLFPFAGPYDSWRWFALSIVFVLDLVVVGRFMRVQKGYRDFVREQQRDWADYSVTKA